DTTTAQLQDLSPGVGYDVQIRAVDKTGNIGAWSSTTTFVASSDNLPPSTPAAPTVAGSRIAVQVTHTLGKSSGGTFNLESDLDHLEIHVSYEPTFTPTAATLVGKTAANASMIQAQIPVVFTAQIEETSARYVRVVAVDKTGNKSGPSDAASATALLIDDAHISDLTVSKVTAGTITAAWVMAGEIKTADTGARARISASGYELYDTGGTRTFFADASTGNVSIVGQIVSGTAGKRLEINPTGILLPEIRFYPSSGTDYAYINSTSSGSDSNLGLNSSPYDDGGGTQVMSRAYMHTVSGARLEVVTLSGELARGGYATCLTGSFASGHRSSGTDGGTFYANSTYGQVGWNFSDSTNAQYFNFSSGKTYHIGKFENYVTAASNQGLFTGSVVQAAAFAMTLTYGPTMDSAPVPVATCAAGSFGSATPTVWGVQSFGTTNFTVAWNNSMG
ncbi:fibronectin type III domain-containing protein, partial [Streptomyces sp. EN27]